MESAKKKITLLAVAFALVAAVAFALAPHKDYVAADEVTHDVPEIAIYQGADNRYYYCGDLSEGTLYHMLYSTHYMLWQGNEEFCRVYAGNAVQTASAHSDSIRATVISKNGKISLGGEIAIYDDTPGDGCRVGIAVARGGDLEETEWLVPVQKLVKKSTQTTPGNGGEENENGEGDETTDPEEPETPAEPETVKKLVLGSDTKNIEVSVGDVVMYVVEAMQNSCGAVFAVDITYDEIRSSGVPVNNIEVSSIPVGTNLAYSSDGNVMADPNHIFLTAMATDNRPEDNLQYVYQTKGMNRLYVMDFAGWETAGYWYTMPNSLNSVGAVWQNKFYTNPGDGYGYSGLCYTAPTDGLVSVVGATARSSTHDIEIGDDKAAIGTSSEFARWELIKVSGDKFTTLCGDTIVPDELKSIEEVDGTQDIELKAGEKVFLRYSCSAPWKVSCITAAFSFTAPPSDVFEGWLVSGDVTEAQYAEAASLTQGANSWYSAYGDVNGKYYLFDVKDGKYTGRDAFGAVGIDGNRVTASASSPVMRVYKAVGSGSAVITGNIMLDDFVAADAEIAVYKRAYDGESWGEATLLSNERMYNTKLFSEFRRTETLSNGDLIMIVVKYHGAAVDGVTIDARLNVHVDFTVSEEGAPVEGIGAVLNLLLTEWYPSYQGEKGWFCAYGSIDNYVLMDYGFGNDNYAHWFGPEWNNAIDVYKQMPSAYSGALRIYVTDRAGELTVEGMAQLLKTDGLTGVEAAIYHNGNSVWSHDYARDELDAVEIEVTLTVGKGDVIALWCANKRGDTVAYGTEFYYNIAYRMVSDSEDIAPEDTFSSYISPKGSYAEYLGIASRGEEGQKPAAGKKGCSSGVGASAAAVAVALIASAVCVLTARRKIHE